MVKILLWILVVSFSVGKVYGQFGKNKVNWEVLDWQQLKSQHFTLIFESNIKLIAQQATTIAENAYNKLSQLFGHQIKENIPIILYSSEYKFQQTNVVKEFLEGVAGFAELFKYRIVLPFNGSYKDLYHTLNHELVHIFCYDILYGRPIKTANLKVRPPDWLMEGLAEYLSLGEQLTGVAQALLIDAVFNNKLSTISELNDFSLSSNIYFAYVQSHSFICWLSKQYGIKKVIRLLYTIKEGHKLDKAISKIFASTLEELITRWHGSLKKIYYPQIQYQEILGQESCSKHITDGRYFFVSYGGDILAVIVDEFGVPQIKFVSTEGKEIKTITKGLPNKEYEFISHHYPMVTFNNSADKLAFVAKYKNKDAIFIFDILSSQHINKVIVDEVDSIFGLCYVTDKEILISGIKDGYCSLYLVNLETNNLEKLSQPNLFSMDIYPAYLGQAKIAFVRSDTVFSASTIIVYNLTTKEEIPLITLPYAVENLTGCADYLLFSCDMQQGVNQIYRIDLSDGRVSRLTNYIGGAHLAYLHNEKFILSGVAFGEFKIYLSTSTPVVIDISTAKSNTPTIIPTTTTYTITRYQPKLSVDYSWGYLTYSSEVGIVSEVELAASDVLGDHRVILRTLPYREKFSNFYFIYQYLAKRPDIFCGIFNVTDAYLPERAAGIFFATQYPLDKFQRVEYANFLAKKKYLHTDREELINEHSVGYVVDRGIWGGSWYVSGQRLYVMFDYAPKLTKKCATFQNFSADLRLYKTVKGITYVFQILPLKASWGKDRRTFYMGGVGFFGDYDSVVPLRGFRYAQFQGNIISKAAFEVRFPLIKSLAFSFPVVLRNLNGVVFAEWAGAWAKNKYSWGGAIGSGIRLLVFLPLRIDLAYKYYNNKFSKTPTWHFSLGYDF